MEMRSNSGVGAQLPWSIGRSVDSFMRGESRAGRAARGSMAGVLARLIAAAASIVTVPLLLGYLGVESYGLWVTASTVAAWVSLWHFGIPASLLNRLAAVSRDDAEKRSTYVATAWWVSVALGCASLMPLAVLDAMGVWASLFNVSSAGLVADARAFALAMWVAVVLTMPLAVPLTVLRVDQDVDRAAAVDVAATLARVSSIVVAVHLDVGHAWLVVVAVALPLLVMLAAALVVLRGRTGWPGLRHFSWRAARLLVRTGSGFFGLGVAALFITSVDVLIVVQLLGPAAVPTYSVAFALFMLFVGLQVAVLDGLWPGYVEAFASSDRAWIERAHRAVLRSLVAAAVVFAVGLVAFGRQLILMWAGPDAVPPQSLLVVFGVIAVVQAFEISHGRVLIAAGRVRMTTTLSLVGAAVNVPVSIALGTVLGVTGVALGTLAAYLLVGGVLVRNARMAIREITSSETSV